MIVQTLSMVTLNHDMHVCTITARMLAKNKLMGLVCTITARKLANDGGGGAGVMVDVAVKVARCPR